MKEHIDYDCSAILRGKTALDQSDDGLLDMLKKTCNGRLPARELLGPKQGNRI